MEVQGQEGVYEEGRSYAHSTLKTKLIVGLFVFRLRLFGSIIITSCAFSPNREAISTVCERRGVDVDGINVYLDSSTTPLPLLTTETSWLGGRLIRIRGKARLCTEAMYSTCV